MTRHHTVGVQKLLGDPKKAILSLSVPMIIAMSIQTIYNFVDALWVAGLGADALSAVGFFLPFFFVIMAISNGIGIGGSSALSRRIGSGDVVGADRVAIESILLGILAAVIFTIPTVLLSHFIFDLLGAGQSLDLAVDYAQVMFGGSIVFFFGNIANSLLRGEGDTKRAMYAMAVGSILNIILDPIMIYWMDMGVAGAAWATVISMTVSSLLLVYWLLIKKDTFISFSHARIWFSKEITSDILKVGLPSSVQQATMSLSMFILNGILVIVSGTDGVAVYTSGWRIMSFATLPSIGIATAVTAVAGAAYGMRAYANLKIAHLYAIKVGAMIELVVALSTFLLARPLSLLFTRAETASHLTNELTSLIMILSISYVFIPFGMLSSSLFQGVGKGINALIVTIWRTIILTSVIAYVLAIMLDMGMSGVWWGVVLGNCIGSLTTFIWARIYVRNIQHDMIST